MSVLDPSEFPNLPMLHVRKELVAYLAELVAADPRPRWSLERKQGLVSGIDQVFHFFFDDHDFDEADIGLMLLDHKEVSAIGAVKQALAAILDDVGDVDEDEFVEHRLWSKVSQTACAASKQMKSR